MAAPPPRPVAEPRSANQAAGHLVASAADRTAAYLERALKDHAASVAIAPKGQRNATLNRAAFGLGQLVAGVGLNRERVEAELVQAAESCGLTQDDGPPVVVRTIRSGLEAGFKQPRGLPESSDKPPAEPASNARPPQKADQRRTRPVHYLDLEKMRVRACHRALAGRFAEGDVALLAGDGGIGKSTTAAALALAMASGTPWCGIMPTRAVRVLYFDEEQSEDEVARIFLRLLPPGARLPKNLSVAAGQGINLKEGLPRLEREIAIHRPEMVILDSVQQVIGGQDENSATAVGALFAELFRLRRDYDTGFLLLHHLRKPPGEGHLAPYHLIRGTGAFFTQSSTSWVATQPARGLLDLQQYKRRRGERTSLRIRYEAPKGPEGPATLTGEGPVEDQETQTERAQAFVIGYLETNGSSKAGTLVEAGGALEKPIPERAVQRALKQLSGPLKAIERPARGLYRLPPKGGGIEDRLAETW
jgi:hypothetical protein